MPPYTVREECDKRTGEYRENEAGKDRDPFTLHSVLPARILRVARSSLSSRVRGRIVPHLVSLNICHLVRLRQSIVLVPRNSAKCAL